MVKSFVKQATAIENITIQGEGSVCDLLLKQ